MRDSENLEKILLLYHSRIAVFTEEYNISYLIIPSPETPRGA